MTINWLEFERQIRQSLRDYASGNIVFDVALRQVDNQLAEFTRRGNELPADRLEWEAAEATAISSDRPEV